MGKNNGMVEIMALLMIQQLWPRVIPVISTELTHLIMECIIPFLTSYN